MRGHSAQVILSMWQEGDIQGVSPCMTFSLFFFTEKEVLGARGRNRPRKPPFCRNTPSPYIMTGGKSFAGTSGFKQQMKNTEKRRPHTTSGRRFRLRGKMPPLSAPYWGSSCGTARYNADEQGDFEPYHAAFLAARLCIRGEPCPPRLGGRGSGGISL